MHKDRSDRTYIQYHFYDCFHSFHLLLEKASLVGFCEGSGQIQFQRDPNILIQGIPICYCTFLLSNFVSSWIFFSFSVVFLYSYSSNTETLLLMIPINNAFQRFIKRGFGLKTTLVFKLIAKSASRLI